MRLINHTYEQRRLRLMACYARGEVLDVGYAQSPNAFFSSECTVTGLDLQMPEQVPKGYADCIVGDVMEVQQRFPGRQFDSVVAGELVEHLENPYVFLREVRELLRAGGVLVLSTPNPLGWPMNVMEWCRGKRFYSDDHLYAFSPRWVVRMLERTGYQLRSMRGVGLWLGNVVLPWVPTGLSYQVIYVAGKQT